MVATFALVRLQAMSTTEETTKPDAEAIKAWAKRVKEQVADADKKIQRAQTRIATATADLQAAQSERVGLNEDAALLGLATYEPDDTPKTTAAGTNHERVLQVLKASKTPMARKAIATELDAEVASVGNALTYLKKNGKIKPHGEKAATTWSAA